MVVEDCVTRFGQVANAQRWELEGGWCRNAEELAAKCGGITLRVRVKYFSPVHLLADWPCLRRHRHLHAIAVVRLRSGPSHHRRAVPLSRVWYDRILEF